MRSLLRIITGNVFHDVEPTEKLCLVTKRPKRPAQIQGSESAHPRSRAKRGSLSHTSQSTNIVCLVRYSVCLTTNQPFLVVHEAGDNIRKFRKAVAWTLDHAPVIRHEGVARTASVPSHCLNVNHPGTGTELPRNARPKCCIFFYEVSELLVKHRIFPAQGLLTSSVRLFYRHSPAPPAPGCRSTRFWLHCDKRRCRTPTLHGSNCARRPPQTRVLLRDK